jgi:transcriptional antiterminator RfaH
LPGTSGHETTISAIHPTSCAVVGDASAAWYAIWTRSHCERLVAGQLAAKGIPPFLPEMCVRSSRRGVFGLVRAPMFPGYLFVHQSMDKDCYVEVLKTRGVVRVLEDGWTRLTPIPDPAIAAIQRIVEADVPAFAHPHLAQGELVSIVEGPLTGIEGVFVRGNANKGCLVIAIDLLGRSVAVEIACTAVEPLPSRKAA